MQHELHAAKVLALYAFWTVASHRAPQTPITPRSPIAPALSLEPAPCLALDHAFITIFAMPERHHFDDVLKIQGLTMLACGKTVEEVWKALDIPIYTLYRLRQKAKSRGWNPEESIKLRMDHVVDAPHPGRPGKRKKEGEDGGAAESGEGVTQEKKPRKRKSKADKESEGVAQTNGEAPLTGVPSHAQTPLRAPNASASATPVPNGHGGVARLVQKNAEYVSPYTTKTVEPQPAPDESGQASVAKGGNEATSGSRPASPGSKPDSTPGSAPASQPGSPASSDGSSGADSLFNGD